MNKELLDVKIIDLDRPNGFKLYWHINKAACVYQRKIFKR